MLLLLLKREGEFKPKRREKKVVFPGKKVSKGWKNPGGAAAACPPAKEGDKYERYTRQVEQVAALVSPCIARVRLNTHTRRKPAAAAGPQTRVRPLHSHTHTHTPPLCHTGSVQRLARAQQNVLTSLASRGVSLRRL